VSFEFYISPLEYLQAESNGITPQTLEKRIRTFAWDKQKAITKKPVKRRDLTPYRKLAEINDIPIKVFNGRMRNQYDPMRAATQPVMTRTEIMAKLYKLQDNKRTYPKGAVQKAKSNGVQYRTLQWRMRHGWTLEDAVNTKTLTTKEASSRACKESYWSKGPKLFAKKGVR